jgi:hypothetical protein
LAQRPLPLLLHLWAQHQVPGQHQLEPHRHRPLREPLLLMRPLLLLLRPLLLLLLRPLLLLLCPLLLLLRPLLLLLRPLLLHLLANLLRWCQELWLLHHAAHCCPAPAAALTRQRPRPPLRLTHQLLLLPLLPLHLPAHQ